MSDVTIGADTPEKHRNLVAPWPKGTSGNPKGRPRGSRHKLAEEFLADLAADWASHGAESIERLRKADVATYVKVVAATLPKELDVSVSQFHDVTSIVEAFRLSQAVIGGDTENLRKYLPALEIEHDAD